MDKLFKKKQPLAAVLTESFYIKLKVDCIMVGREFSIEILAQYLSRYRGDTLGICKAEVYMSAEGLARYSDLLVCHCVCEVVAVVGRGIVARRRGSNVDKVLRHFLVAEHVAVEIIVGSYEDRVGAVCVYAAENEARAVGLTLIAKAEMSVRGNKYLSRRLFLELCPQADSVTAVFVPTLGLDLGGVGKPEIALVKTLEFVLFPKHGSAFLVAFSAVHKEKLVAVFVYEFIKQPVPTGSKLLKSDYIGILFLDHLDNARGAFLKSMSNRTVSATYIEAYNF